MKNHLILCAMLVHTTLPAQDCPPAYPATFDPPSNIVKVEILSIDPNTDMEGDDDYVPFYNNRADLYGTVTIDGVSFDLPKKEDDDNPHWGAEGAFEQAVSSESVQINISIKESDGGLTGDDDVMDINPVNGKSDLDLEFNLCSYLISGDIQPKSAIEDLSIHSGSGDSQGTIRLRISTADGRPSTSDDLALIDVQLVQTIYSADALVARKPMIVMARIANNYSTPINTTFNFQLMGSGMNINASEAVALQAGEVKKEFFFTQNPIMIPANAAGQGNIAYIASVDDPNAGSIPSDDCRAINDGNRNRHPQTVIRSKDRYRVEWVKVGTLLDGFNLTPDTHFDSIFQLGASYIDAVYPISRIVHHQSNNGIIPPLSGGVLSFLTTLISPFVPDFTDPRFIEPYVLVMELDGIAHIMGYDMLMGVLPSGDWFDRYPHLEDLTGLSLGEFMPRAVILEPRKKSGAIPITLPAHEMGHTFGLSVDSRLKNSWVCAVDWPVLGSAGCGLVGGFDEYKHDIDSLQDGNTASGYWVNQGNVPPAIAALQNAEQCNSHCFMGRSPGGPHLLWDSLGRWIDNADYNHLLRKVSQTPVTFSNSFYVSGWIGHNDAVYVDKVFLQDKQSREVPVDTIGIYQMRFTDAHGYTLDSINLQLYWKFTADSMIAPVTPFSLVTELPPGSDRFEIINRKNGKVIHSRELSRKAPRFKEVEVYTSKKGDHRIEWRCYDEDSDEVLYMVVAGDGRENWELVEYWTGSTKSSLAAKLPFRAVKILAWDGTHLVESPVTRLTPKP
jgi:hypothetical protein